MTWHSGRAWSGHVTEDACPCEQAPCGLVVIGQLDGECTEHTGFKTMRQSHRAEHCPGHG